MSAAKQLQDWLTRRGLSAIEFAQTVSVSRQRIYQLLDGDAPSLDLAVRIERTTGIPASAWVNETAAQK